MIRYRVFTLSSIGELHYGSGRSGVSATSTALGYGPPEVDLIVEAHGLGEGSLIHIAELWIRILSVEPLMYDYLPPYSDAQVRVGDGAGSEVWSMALAGRLLREAALMEARLGN